jgi:hypothetical protein
MDSLGSGVIRRVCCAAGGQLTKCSTAKAIIFSSNAASRPGDTAPPLQLRRRLSTRSGGLRLLINQQTTDRLKIELIDIPFPRARSYRIRLTEKWARKLDGSHSSCSCKATKGTRRTRRAGYAGSCLRGFGFASRSFRARLRARDPHESRPVGGEIDELGDAGF